MKLKRIIFSVLAAVFMFMSVAVFGQSFDDKANKVFAVKDETSDKDPNNHAKGAFKDLKGHWAESLIQKMVGKGHVKGISSDIFAPNQTMTRAQFIAVLHRTLGIQINYFKAPDIKEFFNDVKNDSWYAMNLYDMVISNIVDDTKVFRPNAPITREEMVHYLMNAFREKGGKEIPTKDFPVNKYVDAKDVSPQYINDMNAAIRLEFIKGDGKDRLRPKAHSSRAEAIVMIDRMLSALEKKNQEVKVEVLFEMGKDGYTMKLVITNGKDQPITIKHTSGQKFDFALLDKNQNVLYRWSADKQFIAALTETVIDPGKTVEFSDIIKVNEHMESLQKAQYLQAWIVGTSEDFSIVSGGYLLKLNTGEKPLPTEGVSVDPSATKKQDRLVMKLRITNHLKKDITIDNTSGQKFDFVLLDKGGKEIYRWSDGRAFIQILMSDTIKAGEFVEFTEVLEGDQAKDLINRAQVMKALIVGTSNDFHIEKEGYEVQIQ